MIGAAPPADDRLARFLDEHAPFTPVPLCPELCAFAATSLVGVWAAAEALAGSELPSPFWAFPWPAGMALARVILDAPELVRGRTVIDVGAGGGVSSMACALAGAAHVVACDSDPWALAVTRIAAERQHCTVETRLANVTVETDLLDAFDVVLAGDLAYDRSSAPHERAALERAARRGATVLHADAGRRWFLPGNAQLIAQYTIPVVKDLEGHDVRVARVYRAVVSPGV